MSPIDQLKTYKENSTTINNQLREGNESPEFTVIDELFSEIEVPPTLYRLIDNVHIHFESGIFCDSAYLSCTDEVDNFIHKTGPKQHLACLNINMPSSFPCINVKELLTEYDDEGEFILPRNLRLKLLEHPKVYSDVRQFDEFLDKYDCSIGSNQLRGEGIKTISLYTLEIVKDK